MELKNQRHCCLWFHSVPPKCAMVKHCKKKICSENMQWKIHSVPYTDSTAFSTTKKRSGRPFRRAVARSFAGSWDRMHDTRAKMVQKIRLLRAYKSCRGTGWTGGIFRREESLTSERVESRSMKENSIQVVAVQFFIALICCHLLQVHSFKTVVAITTRLHSSSNTNLAM